MSILQEASATGDLRARRILGDMFKAAVASADPVRVLARFLPEKPSGRCVVVGAGKSAAVMARAVEKAWGDVDLSGVVVTRYGHTVPTERIVVLEASHPVPDLASERAARRILSAVQGLGSDDLVLALISGGGSSLMALPTDGLTLDDKRTVNRLLLASGLGINEMNQVRRRLSAIKGGRLAEAARPARMVTLAISDVPSDDPRAFPQLYGGINFASLAVGMFGVAEIFRTSRTRGPERSASRRTRSSGYLALISNGSSGPFCAGRASVPSSASCRGRDTY